MLSKILTTSIANVKAEGSLGRGQEQAEAGRRWERAVD